MISTREEVGMKTREIKVCTDSQKSVTTTVTGAGDVEKKNEAEGKEREKQRLT